MSGTPTLKVAAPTLAGALGTISLAATRHVGDPATIAAAALTVTQFVLGYLVPHKPIPLPRRKPKPKPPTGTITMFDTVTPSAIGRLASTSSDAVAGYIDGRFRDLPQLAIEYPGHRHFSIAVFWTDDGDFLDVETGDATPAQVPAWVKRQFDRGSHFVGLYANGSTWPAIFQALLAAGISPHRVVKWLAQPTGKPHIPPGFDGCQYSFTGPQGQNVDESIFWAASLAGFPV